MPADILQQKLVKLGVKVINGPVTALITGVDFHLKVRFLDAGGWVTSLSRLAAMATRSSPTVGEESVTVTSDK